MTFDKVQKLSEVTSNYDLIMFDLWGVLVEGGALYPGVADVVNKLMENQQVLFVSNAPRARKNAADRIRNFGINCKDEQMFTSGQMSKDLIDNNSDHPMIYHLSAGQDNNNIEDGYNNLTSNIKEASIMLLTAQLDEDQDLESLNSILQEAADRSIHCICANPDKIIPNRGKLRYCPGYFADIYQKMGGKVTYIGKPGKDIFLQAISSIKDKPKRILMIGDTLDTDILGARNAGIDSALVLTGNIGTMIAYCRTEQEKLSTIEDFCKSHDIIPTMLIDITA
jgi:HAD superfamily hydrolase (TIGR01459 family)